MTTPFICAPNRHITSHSSGITEPLTMLRGAFQSHGRGIGVHDSFLKHKMPELTDASSFKATNRSCVEIRREHGCALLRCGERDVAIGPYQIQAVSIKTGALHLGLPRKVME